ncbi:multidrug effflux MFS transporter [Roseibium limicola]|uniref:Bcr/CflA family efflux transporter n=1 Tax=Roseibium limicola TaxID=2816037 RepID=A0A939EQ90_9HYPH|nr:multidrug effflux MFS transporter [Roseibium limicola]MBO0346602.1 multidrug effflux MFS transporter [Roseibium limicola]
MSETAIPLPQLMSARRTTLLGAALVAIGPLTMALYTPAMPTLATELHTTDALIKLTLTAYFAGFALTQLVAGPLTDAFGRKPVTLIFLGLYLASSVLATVAPSVEWLITARVLQGIGAAVGITVSRAIVRDQYTGQTSAQIMNTIGTMLALAPAVSPTIGGLILEFFGWHEIFYAMVIYGAVLMVSVIFLQEETNTFKNRDNIRPSRFIGNYWTLLTDRRFLAPSLVVGCGLGNIYALATVQAFVLIQTVGMSPSEYGFGMVLQSASFIAGTLVTGRLLKRHDATHLIVPGIIGILVASLLMATLLRVFEPSYILVMGPCALYVFFIAMLMPATFTTAMRDFPHIAGAASSLMGFFQFGSGIVGSLIIAALGDPILGITTVTAILPAFGIACYLVFSPKKPPLPGSAG